MTIQKKALLIGINYTNTPNELAGCQNDALNVGRLLEARGYTCTYLLDRPDCKRQPTRMNILAACSDLVVGAGAGESLFFHYSGHGTFTRDFNGDESDGRDEALCPSAGGIITDDELRKKMTARLGTGVTLYMLLDCCHSGTGADLRYNYEDTSVFVPSVTKPIKKHRTPAKYLASQWEQRYVMRLSDKCPETRATVICLSGCRDSQYSMDTAFDGSACGAMTYAFMEAVKMRNANVLSVFGAIAGFLRCSQFEQIPQLSLGKRETIESLQFEFIS